MISLRLNEDLESTLNQISETENMTKTDIIKKALILYFEKYQRSHSPYDLGEDLFGKYGSGEGDLSRDYKTILKDKLNEKHSH